MTTPKQPTSARSAKSGEFVDAATAKRRPATTVTETRKAKQPGVLAWALQDRVTGELYLRHICATLQLANEHRAERALPDRVRVVRIRVEIVD